MSLLKLDIYSLRNIVKASIEPAAEINLIIGENGSGKSSLLEAIFILGRARSFRASNIKQVIQFEHTELIVSGQLKQHNGHTHHLGIQFNQKGCEIRVNKENSNKSELAYSLPILLIHPKSYLLLDGGPQIRREFLDWGVFNYHDDFLICWRNFKKVLQQRNALLKTKKIAQINVWNTELIQYGTIVTKYRNEYIRKLEPVFFEICILSVFIHEICDKSAKANSLLFFISENKLYVNEIAPRPHNSGHFSLDACNVSQFDQQVLALIGRDLEDIRLEKNAVMLNLLGDLWLHNGEIKKPGSYPYIKNLTVEKAVALAGGFSERASRSTISLVSENDKRFVKAVALNDKIKPGDVITVSESFF